MITVVVLLSLALLLAELAFLLVSFIRKKNRAERIDFIRSFKKGKCVVIYLTAVPLYWVGHVYAGEPVLDAFFSSLTKIFNLVVLRYDMSSIRALLSADALYKFTIYFCYVLVAINAAVLTISLTMQRIWAAKEHHKAMCSKKEKLFLFGNNPHNLLIYESERKRNKIIVDKMSDADCTSLYKKGVSYISTNDIDCQTEKIFDLVSKLNKESIIVINTENDESNLSICKKFVEKISKLTDEDQKTLFFNVRIFVFGDPKYETVYEGIVKKACGCIHYVNKYQKIAMDFIDKYPLSLFMTEEHVCYKNSLVKNDVSINVFFVGFGKTSQQIFLTSVANNQFLHQTSKGIDTKRVNYHIFDKYDSQKNKNLNHSYYRYKNERHKMNQDDYLPLPSLPAKERFNLLDINDENFYNGIYKYAMNGSKTLNFVIISFGTDLENIDMAHKLIEKRKEWEIKNFVIFVKIRSEKLIEELPKEPNCYPIGVEKEVVYNIDKLIGDKIYRMAKMRNEVYDIEKAITKSPDEPITDESVKDICNKSAEKWYVKKSQLERESSLYCCLSLRSKLNLMGLDYCEKKDPEEIEKKKGIKWIGKKKGTEAIVEKKSAEAIGEKEYLKIYAGDDMPNTSKYTAKANGKAIVTYDIDFAESRRKTMAMHEHQRWNAFMISKGMVPATKDQIRRETDTNDKGEAERTDGKRYSVRRHGNITSFEGLIEFRQLVAQETHKPEKEHDVIKYDYQLLDDAFWLLDQCGFKIIRKK